jgi:hypothetical protein
MMDKLQEDDEQLATKVMEQVGTFEEVKLRKDAGELPKDCTPFEGRGYLFLKSRIERRRNELKKQFDALMAHLAREEGRLDYFWRDAAKAFLQRQLAQEHGTKKTGELRKKSMTILGIGTVGLRKKQDKCTITDEAKLRAWIDELPEKDRAKFLSVRVDSLVLTDEERERLQEAMPMDLLEGGRVFFSEDILKSEVTSHLKDTGEILPGTDFVRGEDDIFVDAEEEKLGPGTDVGSPGAADAP